LDQIVLAIKDGVAVLCLNRPRSRNAITLQMAKELEEALALVAQSPGVGALIVTGAGGGFCSGADLEELATAVSREALVSDLAHLVHQSLTVLRSLPIPVIAAVNGPAAGGGFSLALSCDLVVAGESSRFSAGYLRVGLTPDAGSSYWLPRLVGSRRATELLLLGRVLNASEALQWGLINSIEADANVLAAARTWATTLAHGPRAAVCDTKRLLERTWHHTLAEQLDAERQAVSSRAASGEGAEGIQAFLDRRAPRFPR
jgi:2-(1,2-epoxy-1,2-dihydrophenyl)acetyl-CoA isomerase